MSDNGYTDWIQGLIAQAEAHVPETAPERLLNDLRQLYRHNDTSGAFRRTSDAYRDALAALPQIPERQRRNVYEQTLFTSATLTAAVSAANRREATRAVRITEDDLRVETVQAWGCGDAVDIEVYNDTTGDLLAARERIADHTEQVAMDLYVQVRNSIEADVPIAAPKATKPRVRPTIATPGESTYATHVHDDGLVSFVTVDGPGWKL